jgi:hypothetical protein
LRQRQAQRRDQVDERAAAATGVRNENGVTMSAYIVGHDHIDALLTFALSKRYGRGVVYTANETLIEINCDNASEIGRILLTENERSVRHCYPNDAADDLPRTIGEDSANYEFSPFDGGLTPVAVLKGCDCFDFQAYETDDYKSSIASAIIDAIRKRAILCLPGYNVAAGWGTSFSDAREAARLQSLHAGAAAADFIANIGNTSPEHACWMLDGDPHRFINIHKSDDPWGFRRSWPIP